MDIDRLVKRLAEFHTLADQLRSAVGLPGVETCATLESLSNEVRQILDGELSATGQAGDSSFHGKLLQRLLDINQRLVKESQQHLSLLKHIFANNPAGLAVVAGENLTFQVASPIYYAALPSPRSDIIGLPYREAWQPELGFHGDGLVREFLHSNVPIQLERIEERYPDGRTHSLSLRFCRLSWNDQPAALILLFDTTRADQAQQLSQAITEDAYRKIEELDAIIMAMAEAIILFDENGMATRANPAAVELFGINPVGFDQPDLIDTLGFRHPDGSPVAIETLAVQKALRGETISGQHLLFVDSNGLERVVMVSASPLFSSTGVTSVVTVWHDVTVREHLLEQIEIEQSRLATIIENAPEGILVADEEGSLVRANPAAERILGRPLPYGEDFHALVQLRLSYPDGTPYDPRNLPLTCSALDGEWHENIEMRTSLADDQVRHLLISTAPIVDRKGNLNGAVGVLQDISGRKQTEEELRRQASRSELLASLSQAFAEAGLNYKELLNTIVQQVGYVLGDVCSLHVFSEEDSQHYPAAFFFQDEEMQRAFRNAAHDIQLLPGQELVDHILSLGQPALYSDLRSEEVKSAIPEEYWPLVEQYLSGPVNGLIVPLRVHGRWIGILNVIRFQVENKFSEEDQVFLQDLADRAALAVEDARLYEHETRRTRELEALNLATQALLSTLDLESLLAQIMEAARNAFPGVEQGALYLLTEDEVTLEVRAIFGIRDPQDIRLDEQAYYAVQEKKSIIRNAVMLTGRPGSQPGMQSAMVAPLMLAQRVLGSLVLVGPQPDMFFASDLRLLDSFAATATAALQNATLYSEVQRLATTDTLTEQYNRRRFFELGEMEMHRFRRLHMPLSAIMFDLDFFKDINDTYGHSVGDQVLHEVALRCQKNIRVIDILGRYGGDEFAILLPDARAEEAKEIADRIRQAVTSEPVQTSSGDLPVTLSLGVSQATGETESLSALLGRADTALYAAKQKGRNQVASL